MGIGPREGVLLGANLGAPLYPIWTLRRTFATVPQPSELWFGVLRAVGRGIAVLDGGPPRPRGRGGFEGFCYPLWHFYNGKCHCVADREMFPIRVRKLHISVRQTYCWKARFVGFLAIYSVSISKFGFMRNEQKRNDCSTKPSAFAAKLPA